MAEKLAEQTVAQMAEHLVDWKAAQRAENWVALRVALKAASSGDSLVDLMADSLVDRKELP